MALSQFSLLFLIVQPVSFCHVFFFIHYRLSSVSLFYNHILKFSKYLVSLFFIPHVSYAYITMLHIKYLEIFFLTRSYFFSIQISYSVECYLSKRNSTFYILCTSYIRRNYCLLPTHSEYFMYCSFNSFLITFTVVLSLVIPVIFWFS